MAIALIVIILLFNNLNILKANDLESSLPPLKTYNLPETLQNWQVKPEIGDYFGEIEKNIVGYLIWTQFPVKVYVEKPSQTIDTSNFSQLRFQQWLESVKVAIADWQKYFPLTEVETEQLADIIIKREQSPFKAEINPETGLYNLPRVANAQTRYQFYFSDKQVLLHRMIINISPNQTNDYIISAARHEIGHALGIWGHSNQETDIMYFSQVRNAPSISPRDINTLKKIYQQSTRLGGY